MSDAMTVYLVEDDAAVRFGATQALRLAGLTVQAFETAEAVAGLLHGALAGIVVADIRLPGMDGLRLLELAQREDAGLPVILMTGHGDISMAVRAIRAGAYDFIEKPVSADYLVSAVRRALEKRTLTFAVRDLHRQLAQGEDATAMLIGMSPAMRALRRAIVDLADSTPDVLVFGETGTGKELVAQCLHRASRRRARPFVALNCGAMPEAMFESEVFGHEAGAFTGAQRRRIGKIEYATGGTLFLDEIESMPLGLQVKLLRVLQERSLERLGSNETIRIDLRVVSATKVDLAKLSQDGHFRSDLYYRLNVVALAVPPLRERREDIPVLFEHFMAQSGERYERTPPPCTDRMMNALLAHDWPGNVRELRNVADRFVLGVFDGFHGRDRLEAGEPRALPDVVADFERGLILDALRRHRGDVGAASEALRIPRKTLYDKLRRLGLSPGQSGADGSDPA